MPFRKNRLQFALRSLAAVGSGLGLIPCAEGMEAQLTADTYVRASTAKSNFGRAVELRVSSQNEQGLIRFIWPQTLVKDGASVAQATLSLWVRASKPGMYLRVGRITNPAWQEDTVTWKNSSPITSIALSQPAPELPAKGQWVAVDITEFVRFWADNPEANLGILVHLEGELNGNSFAIFDTKENKQTSHNPTLDIELVGAGPTGPTGPTGPIGPTGANGETGSAGATGPAGSTGAVGPDGPAGPAGPAGADGMPGQPGPVGPEGPTGPAGANGKTLLNGNGPPNNNLGVVGDFYIDTLANQIYGPKQPGADVISQVFQITQTGVWPSQGTSMVGPTGATGPQGAAGVTGSTGPQGAAGVTGATGPQGAAGVTGATGPQGAAGVTGATGPQGAAGVTGSTGPQGAAGVTGATGPQGVAGVTGATGPQGAAGVTGSTGPQGAAGVTGATGPQGATGVAGVTGATGPQGVTGPQGATGPAGANGINGSNGATGATGPTGPTGATGPAGAGLAAGGATFSILNKTSAADYATAWTSTPTLNAVQYSTGATEPAAVGLMQWDDDDGTLQFKLKGGSVTLQVGEETVARVVNNEGATLTDGQVVYISAGGTGDRMGVLLAKSDTPVTSQSTLGMVTESIAPGSEGFITVRGRGHDLNTTGMTGGNPLYLSATTAGAVTTTVPPFDALAIRVGFANMISGSTGSIYVNVAAIPQTMKANSIGATFTATGASYIGGTGGTTDAVTLVTGTVVQVTVGARITTATASDSGFVSFSADGLTASYPADAYSLNLVAPTSGSGVQATATYLVSGLTPGTNTFALKYKCAGTGGSNTCIFINRSISVLNLR